MRLLPRMGFVSVAFTVVGCLYPVVDALLFGIAYELQYLRSSDGDTSSTTNASTVPTYTKKNRNHQENGNENDNNNSNANNTNEYTTTNNNDSTALMVTATTTTTFENGVNDGVE